MKKIHNHTSLDAEPEPSARHHNGISIIKPSNHVTNAAETNISKLLRHGFTAIVAASALTISSSANAAITGVNVYGAVPNLAPSSQYSVRVCAASNPSNSEPAFTFQTKVPSVPATTQLKETTKYYDSLNGWSHSYVNFEMSVPVTVEITKIGGPITSANVRPSRKASNITYSGGKAYVTLNNPCNVAVDINNQMEATYTGDGVGYKGDGIPPAIHTISIHANPFLADKPIASGTGVRMVEPGTKPPANFSESTLYFKPGVHDLGINFQIYPNKKYYIPGDAIVYGTFNNIENGENGSNIWIYGHGTISGERNKHFQLTSQPPAESYKQRPIEIRQPANIKLEGIVIADGANNSLKVESGNYNTSITNSISWLKLFSWRVNGDGGGCGPNNEVSNCFLRVQDDALYIQGRKVTEMVVWNDVNGDGMRLASMRPRNMGSSLLVDKIDVIYARHNYWSKSSAMKLAADESGDYGAGVTFANINFSDPFPNGPPISINHASGNFAGVTYENVNIASPTNLSYNGGNDFPIVRKPIELIASSGASINNLTFKNLVIGGTLVTSSNWTNYFNTQGNVYNINFQNSGSTSTYTLSETSPNGSVTFNPPGGTYAAGTVVTVTSVPTSGYSFSGWSGDLSGNTNPTTITMSANRSITANTVSGTVTNYTLTETSPNGSVTFSPAGGTYPAGTVVTVTSVPTSGYSFSGWSGDLSGNTNPTTITMSANRSITANTVSGTVTNYTLTATSPNGGVTFSPAGGTYPAGTVVTVTSVPTSGYSFSGWSGDLSGNTNPTTITMSANRSITANTVSGTVTTYTLTETSPNGSVTFSPAGGTYPAGTVVTVTSVPTSGYSFSGWSGDLSGNTNPTTIIMSANRSITANTGASSGLPSPWQTADIGTVAATGSASVNNGGWTIAGAGDIWSLNDAFRFVHQPSSGDCSVTVRVGSLINTDGWARAGAMIRDGSSSNALNALICVTPGNGVTFQTRQVSGGSTALAQVTGVTAPKWLRITRTGNQFVGSYSDNSNGPWTQVGPAQTFTMSNTPAIGLVVGSNSSGTTTATFDNVSVTP